MELDAKQFIFSEGTYVAEISELLGRTGVLRAGAGLTLFNCPRNGECCKFVFDGVDDSGGDVAGWKFRQTEPSENPLQVLIIND